MSEIELKEQKRRVTFYIDKEVDLYIRQRAEKNRRSMSGELEKVFYDIIDAEQEQKSK